MKFLSELTDVKDYHEAVELFFENRWTDGLAVVPPTPENVEELVRYVDRDPHEEIGEIPPRYGVATIETLAINTVMAGCRPEYFPVVIAAVEAMLEPEHNLNGVQTTTHCSVPLVIINGPMVKRLNVNRGDGVFGGGYRANGTIGRAVRLVLWNLGGNFPGEVDKSTMAHPGKWSYCIGEDEDSNPWEPLHVERGMPAGSDAVTVFTCEAPHSIICDGNARELLTSICSSMATLGVNNLHSMGETLVVLNPRNAAQFHSEGWSKKDIKQHIWENARLPIASIREAGRMIFGVSREYWPEWIDRNNDSQMVPLTRNPADIHLVVAGGDTYFAVVCPGWGDWGGLAVTKPVPDPRNNS